MVATNASHANAALCPALLVIGERQEAHRNCACYKGTAKPSHHGRTDGLNSMAGMKKRRKPKGPLRVLGRLVSVGAERPSSVVVWVSVMNLHYGLRYLETARCSSFIHESPVGGLGASKFSFHIHSRDIASFVNSTTVFICSALFQRNFLTANPAEMCGTI